MLDALPGEQPLVGTHAPRAQTLAAAHAASQAAAGLTHCLPHRMLSKFDQELRAGPHFATSGLMNQPWT